jgi:protoporphyrinogen oxidase
VQITPEIPTEYAVKLNNLQSIGAIVLVLALKNRLTNHYWFNLPATAGFPFLALVEHTNFVSPSYFGGEHIIYCGQYLETDHPNFSMTPEEVTNQFIPALTRFNPDFDVSWINRSWIFRSPYAQPVPSINLSSKIPELQTPIKGLWLASMSQVYPWDRGTNFAIELGRRVAKNLIYR